MAKQAKVKDFGTAGVIFLGVSRPLRLEAEVAPNKKDEFEEFYEMVKGVRPRPIKSTYYKIVNKWGRELRIYFNASSIVKAKLVELGFHVEEGRPYNPQYQYRINSVELWMHLVELGFNLGDNP